MTPQEETLVARYNALGRRVVGRVSEGAGGFVLAVASYAVIPDPFEGMLLSAALMCFGAGKTAMAAFNTCQLYGAWRDIRHIPGIRPGSVWRWGREAYSRSVHI